MPFKPGESGNPGGKPKSAKLFKEALTLAINRTDGDKTKLAQIAEALVEKAVAGDVAAAQFVADRIDGKPTQVLAGDPEAPLFSVEGLRDLLGAKLDRIAAGEQAADPSRVIN